MATEQFIENNVVRNRAQLGYTDSVYIRRCRAGRGFGVVDVMLLPLRGPHRVVLIEAKRSSSVDAAYKVIGQMLLYYAGSLQLGQRGLRNLRQFATAKAASARSTKPKLLKTLTGGISPPEAAWKEMRMGRKIMPKQIAMYIALDAEPSPGLMSTLMVLKSEHELSIGVVSVLARDHMQVWRPAYE